MGPRLKVGYRLVQHGDEFLDEVLRHNEQQHDPEFININRNNRHKTEQQVITIDNNVHSESEDSVHTISISDDESIEDDGRDAESVNVDNELLSLVESTEIFKNEIRFWALNFDTSHKSFFYLILILDRHTEHSFPADPRTLLQTPRPTPIVSFENGNYCHFNLKNF